MAEGDGSGTHEGGSPLREDYLVFGQPQILEPEVEEVLATLRSAWIGTGPRVAAFEEAFREYVGAAHAVAVSSGSAGLHLALLTLGLQPGDEVIVPALTFVATVNAVVHAGGRPVLADVDRVTMCLDPADAAARVTSATRAVVPVHFAGRPCAMDAISGLARRRGLEVIEDAAHATGARYHGSSAGTLGHAAVFSFYATKNVTTGEGGMFITGNAERAARAKRLALHGLSADAWARFSDAGFQHYEVVEPGYKYNMTDLEAALGLHQLARVEANLTRRQEIWARYDEAFADLPAVLPAPEEPGTRHARHLYTLLLDLDRLDVDRDEVVVALHKQNIGCAVHYRAVHLHRYYRELLGCGPADLPNSSWISERTVSLPLSPKLSSRDVEDVIAAVRRVLSHR